MSKVPKRKRKPVAGKIPKLRGIAKSASKRAEGMKPPIAGAGRAEAISDDEAKLWSHVVRDTSALSAKAAGRVAFGRFGQRSGGPDSGEADGEFFADMDMMIVPQRRIGSTIASQSGNAAASNAAAGGAGNAARQSPGTKAAIDQSPGATDFNKRKMRKLAKGRIAIDARIDLHGMRQREAHSALRSFLINAQAKGHRLVLVITGKGQSRRRDGENGGCGAAAASDEPGVLRRSVPIWMAGADLAAIVVSYTSAHQRHGGGGAIYVHLRKRQTRKPRL